MLIIGNFTFCYSIIIYKSICELCWILLDEFQFDYFILWIPKPKLNLLVSLKQQFLTRISHFKHASLLQGSCGCGPWWLICAEDVNLLSEKIFLILSINATLIPSNMHFIDDNLFQLNMGISHFKNIHTAITRASLKVKLYT